MAATCVLRASRLYMYLCIPVGSSAALRVRAMACRPRALRELSPRGAAVTLVG